MAKTIAFRGKEKADFAYYVSKSLASNKNTVAVIDNSYSKDLFDSVNQNDGDTKVIEKENIVYIKDAVVSNDFENKFDYVIYYLGLNDKAINTEYSFILPDYSHVSINETKKLSEELLTDSFFIFRDKVSNRVKEKSIALLLGINVDQVIGYLPLDIKDEVAYESLGYMGRQKIKDTSIDMQLAIMSVLSMVTGDDIKTVKKIFRKAKRNKRL